MCQVKDEIENETLRMAKETIEVADNIKAVLEVYNDKEKLRNEL